MAAIKPRLSVEEAEPTDATTAQPEATAAPADSQAAEHATETAGDQADQAKDKPVHSPRNVTKAAQGWLHATFPGHENAAFGGICGLVVAVLVFVIGFWQTLFITLCVLVGVAVGQYADGNPKVVRFVSKLFQDNRG